MAYLNSESSYIYQNFCKSNDPIGRKLFLCSLFGTPHFRVTIKHIKLLEVYTWVCIYNNEQKPFDCTYYGNVDIISQFCTIL